MNTEKEFRQYLKKFAKLEFPSMKNFIWYASEGNISIHCDRTKNGYLISEHEIITENKIQKYGGVKNKFEIKCKDNYFPAKEIYAKIVI